MKSEYQRATWCVTVLCLTASHVFARGGTVIIATKDQPVILSAGWPDGVGMIINDPARTTGWNSWFSEWPNDVNQYALEITGVDDLNRLIEKLAAIKSDLRQIRLSHLQEPSGLGWVTQLRKGNDIPVIFSIGNQRRIDEWYKKVRKPFGVMEFMAAPVAVPPTLTIFVQNKVVDLDKLAIPKGITISSGYIPTLFHRFNTTLEKKQETEAVQKQKGASAAVQEPLDPAGQAAADKIAAFLKKHNRIQPIAPGAALEVLLPALAQEGKEAEELFGAFEKKLAAAKAVRIRFEGIAEGIDDVPGAIKFKGTMVIAEGNKAHFEREVEMEGKKQKSKLVSDGAKMLGQLAEGNGPHKDTPKMFFEEMVGFFKHGGPVAGHVFSSSNSEGVRSVAAFKASAFKLGKKEKIGKRVAQVIEYNLTMENAPEEVAKVSFSEMLWLDVETNLPLKRVFTGKLNKEFACTENYSEFILNPKVDAKLFELPK